MLTCRRSRLSWRLTKRRRVGIPNLAGTCCQHPHFASLAADSICHSPHVRDSHSGQVVGESRRGHGVWLANCRSSRIQGAATASGIALRTISVVLFMFLGHNLTCLIQEQETFGIMPIF
jgi:hypothetical protein